MLDYNYFINIKITFQQQTCYIETSVELVFLKLYMYSLNVFIVIQRIRIWT